MSAGESDPEIEEWEKNQIRKAVSKNKVQHLTTSTILYLDCQ